MPNNYLSVLYKHNSSGKLKCGVKRGGGGGRGTNIPFPPPPYAFYASDIYIYIMLKNPWIKMRPSSRPHIVPPPCKGFSGSATAVICLYSHLISIVVHEFRPVTVITVTRDWIPGARCSSAVEPPPMVRWIVGSILDSGPIELFVVPASATRQRPWCVLFCLWDSAYKTSLAANRKKKESPM